MKGWPWLPRKPYGCLHIFEAPRKKSFEPGARPKTASASFCFGFPSKTGIPASRKTTPYGHLMKRLPQKTRPPPPSAIPELKLRTAPNRACFCQVHGEVGLPEKLRPQGWALCFLKHNPTPGFPKPKGAASLFAVWSIGDDSFHQFP